MSLDVAEPSAAREQYSARLFGNFLLEEPGSGRAVLLGRKSRALVSYLLLTGDCPVSRDRLTALCWGDRGEEQARASLRQALYEIKSLTGDPVPLVRVGRHEVSLVHGAVQTDLDRWQALAGGHDTAAIVCLLGEHPGELLADLADVDEGFDEWLSTERSRRRDERHAIAIAVARRALGRGDHDGACAVALRLLAAEPFDEAATGLAMEARCLQGDRDGLRRLFARYAEALDREFQAPPPADMTALLERLSSESRGAWAERPGIRETLLPDETVAPQLKVEPGQTAAVAPDRAARRGATFWIGRFGRLAALGCLLILAGILAGVLLRSGHGEAERTMVVEPLDVGGGDSAAGALSDGLASDVARMIVGVARGLKVIDQRDPTDFISRADFAVAGDARTSDGSVHANIRLLDRASGAILWSHSLSRPVGEVDLLRDQIAANLADVATCGLGGHNPGLAELGIETMRLYLRACEEKHGDWGLSAKLLGEVVARRPRFAHAWAMLSAATASVAGDLPAGADQPLLRQAAIYADRALALDPNDGEAYPALADAHPGLRQWPVRYAILKRGLALDPDNAVVNIDLGFELYDVGRLEEGARYAARGMELDPFNKWAIELMLRFVGYGGAPDQLKPYLDQARRLWPGDPDIASLAFAVQAHAGDAAAALQMVDDPANPIGLTEQGKALWRLVLAARLEPKTTALNKAIVAVDANVAAQSEVVPILSDASLYAVLGKPERALSALNRISQPIESPRALFYGYMAPVRAQPGFMAFAARQGLVAIWQETGRWPDFCGDPLLPYNCRKLANDVHG